MTDAGRAAHEAGKNDPRGVYSYENDEEVELDPAYLATGRCVTVGAGVLRVPAAVVPAHCQRWVMSASSRRPATGGWPNTVADSEAGLPVKPMRYGGRNKPPAWSGSPAMTTSRTRRPRRSTYDARPSASRHAPGGWTRGTCLFGHHYDPGNVGHGLLLVNNDDVVKAGTGFDTHPHRDMEIVTWVMRGSLVHQDSTGHSGIIYPGLARG